MFIKKTGIITVLLTAALMAALTGCGAVSGSSQSSRTEPQVLSETETAGSAESAEEEKELRSYEGEAAEARREVYAMDTYMTIACYGEQCEEAADAAVTEIGRIEELLSAELAESEIGRINAEGGGSVGAESSMIIEEALRLFKDTGGAFDITVYPLMRLWGFNTDEPHVPERTEIQKTLEKVGSDQIVFENGRISLGKGQGIDLGGIAKGYTSDRLMEIFAEYELDSAVVSLGGNVQFYKTKPDGSLWNCGVQDPNQTEDESSLMGILKTEDCAVITSGGYERFFKDDSGKVYHHILDPETGYPADHGLKSVTIVSKQGILADGLSTACYVMGLEKSIDLWKNSKEAFDMILMTDRNEVFVTEGIASRYQSYYSIHIVEK